MTRELGQRLGKDKWEIIYGGGGFGLMGEAARSANQSGSWVTGIITKELLQLEKKLPFCSKQVVVNSMSQRKSLMINSADIFLILPGGIGTLDEFFEVWTTKQLGEHNKTTIMMNYENYFDNLLGFIRKMIREDFLLPKHFEDIIVCENIDEIFKELGKF